ncbi:hypothetical protein SAMN06296952_1732 [Oscillospiraceae bacterium]|nr:hypothetical protein SAMN06296952_1732 [Oscillospiraceae bacterium]
MRRIIPSAKKIIIIICVSLIALMNIIAVAAGVRSEIARRRVSYYGSDCSIFHDFPAYSGTITEVQTWSPDGPIHFKVIRIKVKNEEGERRFTIDGRSTEDADLEYRVGDEITFTYYDEDHIVHVFKIEVPPLRVRVFNITLQTLLVLLIPDILLAVLFALIYRHDHGGQKESNNV